MQYFKNETKLGNALKFLSFVRFYVKSILVKSSLKNWHLTFSDSLKLISRKIWCATMWQTGFWRSFSCLTLIKTCFEICILSTIWVSVKIWASNGNRRQFSESLYIFLKNITLLLCQFFGEFFSRLLSHTWKMHLTSSHMI